MLSPEQIHTVLDLIDRQLILFVGTTVGEQGLSEQDKSLLAGYGIDYKHIYNESKDLVKLNFQLGMLSNILEETQAKKLSYKELVKYIESGQNIPLSERERATIDSIKMQSVADIRTARGRIFQDINNVVHNNLSSKKANQQEFLREKIIQGISERKDRKQIAREIAKITGDWSRDFNKSVQYISHTALNEGRSAVIQRRYGSSEDTKVYFQVQRDACDHCIDAYLSSGRDSEPKVFTLKELQENGSNIGRKVKDLKPTVGALHVNCRCLLTEYIPGTVWNGVKFTYSKGQQYQSSLNRPKIRIVFNGKEYLV